MSATETLPSWKEGPAKRAIMDFVTSATTEGPGFVEPADRIAAFDNDGTLWVEKPAPPQADFMIRKWERELAADPSLASKQPYKAIVEKDASFFRGLATQDPSIVAIVQAADANSWAGATPEHYEGAVNEWVATVDQPQFGVGYAKLVYVPMLELFRYLEANGFRVFVCSGDGCDFMRTFAEELWDVSKERVIGSSAAYEYRDGAMRRGSTMLGGLALGPGKPEHIFARTGRLPAFAAGNADVDIEMLESATFAILVKHDDDAREFGYTKAAERAQARAEDRGWTVVSMQDDWAEVFAPGVPARAR